MTVLMKTLLVIITFSLILFLTPYNAVYSEDQIQYNIQIASDGSATWSIIQVADSNASFDSWMEFQNRVTVLVEAAKNTTGREMTAEVESITYDLSGSYVVVEYKFYWKNFSRIEDTKIIIGDVFQVQDFFLQLYGDGEVYMTYPSEYIVETVSPEPYQRDDSHQTLRWLGTNDFADGLSIIILKMKPATPGFLEIMQQNVAIIVGLVIVATGSVSFYVFKHHKRKGKDIAKMPELTKLQGMESDEEKIVKILKSSGGTVYQSAIVDECRFSKAKTSQLLATLEGKGVVNRHKRGRDKIVVLVERDKSET